MDKHMPERTEKLYHDFQKGEAPYRYKQSQLDIIFCININQNIHILT